MKVLETHNVGTVTIHRFMPAHFELVGLARMIKQLSPRKVILFSYGKEDEMRVGVAVFAKVGVYLLDNCRLDMSPSNPHTTKFLKYLHQLGADILFLANKMPDLSEQELLKSFGFVCATPALPVKTNQRTFAETFGLTTLINKRKVLSA